MRHGLHILERKLATFQILHPECFYNSLSAKMDEESRHFERLGQLQD